MKIKKIEKLMGNFRVYNITTKKCNNYFANDVLVHNCFAYFFKSNNPAIKEIHLKAVNVDKMIEALQGKATTRYQQKLYEHFYSRKFLLHWGGLADPFCTFEKVNNIGLKLMDALGELNYPTLFSFKGNTILDRRYQRIFQRYSKQRNFAFQISIVTNNDELSKVVEIGVPTTSERLSMMKLMSDMGYWTILRLRPFIVGVSDEGLDELLERAYQAGAMGVSVEFFAMDSRANVGMKKRYDWLSKVIGVKDLHRYFCDLSPSERGGYMRLNRLVKEIYVKKIYKFCIEHDMTCGISDPDFKELNTSGSCFSGNTQVVIKRNHSPYIKRKSLLGLYESYVKYKMKFKVLCLGEWKDARPVRISYNRDWYKVILRNGASMLVTDDHVHFTKEGEKHTLDLVVGDFILFNSRKMFVKSERGTYDLGRFVGLYIAEGSSGLNGKKGGFGFCFGKHEKQYYDFVRGFVFNLGGFVPEFEKTVHKIHENCSYVDCYSVLIKNILSSFVKGSTAKTKRLKEICFDMSEGFRKGLLDGWMEGDGRSDSRKYLGANSSSRGLVWDMYCVAVTLGMPVSTKVSQRENAFFNGKQVKGTHLTFDFGVTNTKIINEGRKKITYKTSKIYRNKIHEINNNFYSQIVDIKRVYINRTKYAYCLDVKDGHRFQLANGIVTHNCCGLPDDFPDNRLIENWTRSQFTYHLKVARQKYHKTGECVKFKFNEVYAADATYLDEKEFTNDHVAKIGVCNADYVNLSQRRILQEKWNNLNSPANPCNYFHGKVMPLNTLDEEGNLIFVYTPMEYEERWKQEGIDLTR